MIKRVFGFCVFMLTISNSYAGIKDSVHYYLKNKYPELIGGLSARNTFIGSHLTSVTGASIGVDYGGKISFSVGVYGLSKPLVERKIINPYSPSEYKVDELSRFGYLGLTGNYVFFKQNRWTLNVPIRVGLGKATIEQRDIAKGKLLLNETSSVIVPLESGIGAQYKLAWWIGLGAGLGSRIVLGKKTSQKFSGTYYNFGINIFFSDIYFHIRNDIKKNPVLKSKK